jgi:hypothetical protein
MKLTTERLARITLARQFPSIRGRGRAAVRQLFDRLGPVQSQVPRAPFLTVASRLPGITYSTIHAAFDDRELIKATNLRGTVHTTRPQIFGAVDAVSRRARSIDQRRLLRLADGAVTPDQVQAAIERFCADDWHHRDGITKHIISWLAERGVVVVQGQGSGAAANVIWGHSGLIRQPHDDHWERRTDTLRRTAVHVCGPEVAPRPFEQSMIELVRIHLSAYGPATRRDVAWWSGCGVTAVDQALTTMADELVRFEQPDAEDLIDLAEMPARSVTDPGLRLLPEFDGLLLGYAPANRDRFIDRDQLPRVWAKANGMFSPTVLLDGKIAGSWRTLPGRPPHDTVIEVRPFATGSTILSILGDQLDDSVAAVARSLDLAVTDVRLVAPE